MRSKIFPGAVIAFLLVPLLSMAWTGPTAAPPNGNVPAPINTGSVGQVKSGDFAILGNLGVGTPAPSQKLHVVGNIFSTGAIYSGEWVRINGSGGIYWQDYGGGWQMYDTTWIRSYNGKRVYMAAGFDTGDQAGIACGGGLGGGYTFQVCGSQNITNYLAVPTMCLNGLCRSSWGYSGAIYVVNIGSGAYTCGNTDLMVGMQIYNYPVGNVCTNNGCITSYNAGAIVYCRTP